MAETSATSICGEGHMVLDDYLMMQTPHLHNSCPFRQKLLIIIHKEIRLAELPKSVSSFGWIWGLFAPQNTLSWVSNWPGERVSYHQIIACEKG